MSCARSIYTPLQTWEMQAESAVLPMAHRTAKIMLTCAVSCWGLFQNPPLHMDRRSACGQNLLFCPCRLRRRLSVDANLLSSSLQCLLVSSHSSVHCISLQHQKQVLARGSCMKYLAALLSDSRISCKSPCWQTWPCAHIQFCCKC